MTPFLKAVAEGYTDHTGGDLSNHCFVFPNKRARTFFLKYFRNASIRSRQKSPFHVVIAPHSITISDFVAMLADRVVDSRIDLIFLLYGCYKEIAPGAPTFDAFRRWGETVLGDFNEVDMNAVNPEEIFKNLSDFREISTNFLTPEQRAVIEEYFGYQMDSYDDSGFWRDFSEEISLYDSAEKDIGSIPKKKFIRLWKILYPLYSLFHQRLDEKGLASSGYAYKLAIENLEKAMEVGNVHELLPYSGIVMVGFNALSGAELRMFNILKDIPSPVNGDLPMTDFIWDATGPVILRSKNSAGHFVRKNMEYFPEPEWLAPYMRLCDAGNQLPEITSVAAPSKVAQVKIASSLISNLHSEIGDREFDEAKVALVLPDESLLIPMLYSMPPAIRDANLTMGYPLKLTSVTSFLMLLRRLQLLRRDSSAYTGYSFEEMDNLLSHPYAQAIIGHEKIRRFRKAYVKRHIRVVRHCDIGKWLGENAETLLAPLDPEASPRRVCDYLESVLSMIRKHHPNSVELPHIDAWRDALTVFADAVETHGISMTPSSTLAEVYRLLSGESVPFEGEPLKGLQIMGLLETRSLDFDHVYVVSVNDKVIPMRSRQRSFLPNVIRKAYGIPPVNYQENIFSYYFYRLLSRAKRVTLIYDNRSSGLSGGVSRYIMQLKYLHARGRLRELEYKFSPSAKHIDPVVIEKSEEIMDLIKCFEARSSLQSIPVTDQQDSGKSGREHFSASLLKKYLSCPLKFYYYALRRLKDDPEPSEGVDDITFGNILHNMMESLYLPADEVGKGRWLDSPVEITRPFIDSIIADEERLRTMLRRLINRLHYHLPEEESGRRLEPDTEIVAESALIQLKNVLRYDRSLAPFNLYGCEVRKNVILTLPVSGRKINMTFAIDRIDDAQCENNPLSVRIVDYKTGSAYVSADSFEDIFRDDYTSSHLFQLLLYSYLLNEARVAKGEQPLSVKPVIYSIPKIFRPDDRRKSIPSIGGVRIEYHDQKWDEEAHTTVIDEFMGELDTLIEQIFDKNTPFAGIFSEQKCTGCVYANICRANDPD